MGAESRAAHGEGNRWWGGQVLHSPMWEMTRDNWPLPPHFPHSIYPQLWIRLVNHGLIPTALSEAHLSLPPTCSSYKHPQPERVSWLISRASRFANLRRFPVFKKSESTTLLGQAHEALHMSWSPPLYWSSSDANSDNSPGNNGNHNTSRHIIYNINQGFLRAD